MQGESSKAGESLLAQGLWEDFNLLYENAQYYVRGELKLIQIFFFFNIFLSEDTWKQDYLQIS